MTTAQASGPWSTASRSPPQPAAAADASLAPMPGLPQPDAHLELPERVLDRLRPALAHVGGERRRQLSRRPAPRPIGTCRDGGSARSNAASRRRARRPPSSRPAAWTGSTNAWPAVYGKSRLSTRIFGVRSRIASDFGVGAGGLDLGELLGGQVLAGPLDHQQRRVALVDGGPREGAVGLVEQLLLVGEHAEVRVLERVVVFVRERDLVRAVDRARCATRRRAASRRGRRSRRPGCRAGRGRARFRDWSCGINPKRLVQALAAGDVLGRVVLVEVLGGVLLERRLVDGLRARPRSA